jgi:capsular polysaccharide biosynthesis protein
MSTFFLPSLVNRVRQMLVPPDVARPHVDILLVHRELGKARSLRQHDTLVARLEQSGRHVTVFDAQGSLEHHIALFAAASVVVGPHGAGFSNLVFCKQGTRVVEVGWDADDLMEMDNMYMRLSVALGLDYRLVLGHGSYISVLDADVGAIVAEVVAGGATLS